MLFQSMSSLFQSRFSCSPNRRVRVGISFSVVTTRMRSFSRSSVVPMGMVTFPSRHSREITNLVWLCGARSLMVLWKMAGLWIWKAAT